MKPPKENTEELKPPKVTVAPGSSPTFAQLRAAMKKDPDPVPETPEKTDNIVEFPAVSADEKVEPPQKEGHENVVQVCGTEIELKPTKVKYFRNKTASSYSALSAIPLDELFLIQDGRLMEGKSSDEILYNFLIAAFDNDEFIKTHYDEMTAEEVNTVIKIFGRINGIDEKKEAQRKNAAAQARP